MLGNFFSGARKYLAGSVSALASLLPSAQAEPTKLDFSDASVAPRPLTINERKLTETGNPFWWRDKWVSPSVRHQVQNSKPIQAANNRLLQALVKRNAYFNG